MTNVRNPLLATLSDQGLKEMSAKALALEPNGPLAKACATEIKYRLEQRALAAVPKVTVTVKRGS